MNPGINFALLRELIFLQSVHQHVAANEAPDPQDADDSRQHIKDLRIGLEDKMKKAICDLADGLRNTQH